LILIGIGGNLPSSRFGPPIQTLPAALAVLETEHIKILKRSAWYHTEPVPRCDQPWFLNAVVSVATQLGPEDLLEALKETERQFGRVRGQLNASRVLDLDILDYRAARTDTSLLVLPHPRLHQRRFVLLPIADIAPDWQHPIFGVTAQQLLAQLSSEQQVARLPC
jgi:2-amino-4-hydroxy-6-hydroxymethyldihydropteridine diphosphokinase